MERDIWIKTELLPQMMEKGIFNVDVDEKLKLESVDVKALDTEGTFSLTVPYKVKLQFYRGDDKTNTHSIYLVVKVTPQVAEEMYVGCQFDTLFENEMIAYTEIIPVLGNKELYPKYYYSHRKDLEAVMVLGDFSRNGWRMAPHMYNLPLQYILLAVKELGRFHGACYGLKEKDRQLFNSLVAQFKESRYAVEVIDPFWNIIMKQAPLRATKCVRESDFKEKIPEEFLQRIEAVMEDPMTFYKKCVRPKEPLAVICHGDYLRNNIAFQYDDENPEHPKNVMVFDFQTLRYASPVIDLSVFIANSTGYDVRLQHFDEIFKTYHDELITSMCNVCDFKPDDLPGHYSYDSFLKEFAKYYPYGFCIASSFLPILVEPMEISYPPTMEIVEASKTQGGETVNHELRGMILEMYNLQKKFGLEFGDCVEE